MDGFFGGSPAGRADSRPASPPARVARLAKGIILDVGVYAVEDISRHTWWPLPVAEDDELQIGSVWFLVEPDDEPELLGALQRAWAGLEWFGMGTRFTKSAAEAEGGFFARFPDLLQRRTRVVRDDDAVSGLLAVSEWGVLDPASAYLSEFIRVARQGRSRGVGLALTAKESMEPVWHAVSSGALWHSSLALGGQPSNARRFRERVIPLYLRCAAASDLVPLVPLARHPWSGYVIFGRMTHIREMAWLVTGEEPAEDDSAIETLINDGGGPAV